MATLSLKGGSLEYEGPWMGVQDSIHGRASLLVSGEDDNEETFVAITLSRWEARWLADQIELAIDHSEQGEEYMADLPSSENEGGSGRT